MSQRIKVVCRKRPMNRKEIATRQQNVVACVEGAVLVREPKLKVDLTKYIEEHTFQFDNAFEEDVSNDKLYEGCVKPLVDAFLLSNAKCTCFAYGQTGSGKTFTMLGDSNGENPVRGIFPLAVLDLFESLRAREHSGESPRVVASFYEIYCGKLYDLLNSRKHLHARENAHGKVVLQGVRELESTTAEELMSQVAVGLAARTTGVTGANVDSSRSHAIIEISLKRPATNGRLVSSGAKLSFIDLAGSERGADTVEQDKQTRMDGAEINKSLLALKECIRALDQQLDHTPFRGSKLTQVLKDSFVGANCMTLMIANISPSSASVEHTLNTLRYAYRVRELRGAVATRRYLPAATMEPPELVTTDSCNSSSSSSSCSEGEKISSPAPLRNGGVSLSPLSLSKDNLAREHDRLIGVILAEEEELISAHRKSLETFVHMLNEEMAQVNRIDQPGSDVDQYVAYMDGNLAEKERLVSGMRARLAKFKQHLQDEELLSRAFK